MVQYVLNPSSFVFCQFSVFCVRGSLLVATAAPYLVIPMRCLHTGILSTHNSNEFILCDLLCVKAHLYRQDSGHHDAMCDKIPSERRSSSSIAIETTRLHVQVPGHVKYCTLPALTQPPSTIHACCCSIGVTINLPLHSIQLLPDPISVRHFRACRTCETLKCSHTCL